MAAVPRYYYCTNGTDVLGPLSPAALMDLKRAGVIHSDTPTCLEGGDTWQPLSFVLSKFEKREERENLEPIKAREAVFGKQQGRPISVGALAFGSLLAAVDSLPKEKPKRFDDPPADDSWKMGCVGWVFFLILVGLFLLFH